MHASMQPARCSRAVCTHAQHLPGRCGLGQRRPLTTRLHATEESNGQSVSTPEEPTSSTSGGSQADIQKELTKFTRQAATTFAPRPSTATKNPAFKGSTLYQVFEVQAWLSIVVGGLLSFNIIFPTDDPSIPRLMGMWSVWMFTIPSLRARECTVREKDALNLLFLLVPLLNVALPFVWKSFPFIFSADVAAVVGVYAWKGVWDEVYGLPLGVRADGASGSSSK